MSYSYRLLVYLLILTIAVLAPAQSIQAHGGHVSQNQTFTQEIGPYELAITIELPPAVPSPLYINLTPQDDFSQAQVTFRAVPRGFPLDQARSVDVRDQPGTQVYYTQLDADRAGDWELFVEVQGPRGRGQARIPFTISLAQPSSTTLPLIIALSTVAGLMLLNLILTGIAQQRKRPLPAVLERLLGSMIFAAIVAAVIFGTQQFFSQQNSASASGGNPTGATIVTGRPHANVDLHLDPAQPSVGQPVTLSFDLSDGSTGLPIDDLITHHDALLHLALIDTTNSSFAHIHPANVAPGRFEISHTFDRAGEYSAYIEIERIDSGIQVIVRTFSIAGPQPSPAQQAPGLGSRRLGNVDVDVSSSQPLRAGRQTTLTFSLSENGQPISTLEPWLGMAGHLMARDSDGSIFGHIHAIGPMAGPKDVAIQQFFGPDIRFVYTFPKAGRYYLWGQVKYQDTIVTVPVVLDVDK